MFFKKKDNSKKIAKIRWKKILLLLSAIFLCFSYIIDVDAFIQNLYKQQIKYNWVIYNYNREDVGFDSGYWWCYDLACHLNYADTQGWWYNASREVVEWDYLFSNANWSCIDKIQIAKFQNWTWQNVYTMTWMTIIWWWNNPWNFICWMKNINFWNFNSVDNSYYFESTYQTWTWYYSNINPIILTYTADANKPNIITWPNLGQTWWVVIEQTPPADFFDMVDETWTSVTNEECLWANPNTKKYSKPSRFCRMDNFNLDGDESLYNFFCPLWSKFYWFGQYDKTNYKFAMYMWVCAFWNNKTSITNIDKTFSLLQYPYWALWYHTWVNRTTSLYWIRFDTTATWIALESNGAFWPKYLNSAYSINGGFTWSVVEYFQWPEFTDQSTLLKQYGSTTTQNDVWRNFNYIMNNIYINNCNSIYCPFAWKFATKIQKLIEFWSGKVNANTSWSGTETPEVQNTEIDTDIFTCDRDGDGEYSLTEIPVCPFTVIWNIWDKTTWVLDSFMNLLKELLKLWNTETKRMFYNPFLIWQANANWISDAFGQQAQTTLYEWDWFFHNIFSYLYWWAFTILFMAVVTILLIKKK